MNYTITDKNKNDVVVDKHDTASVYLDNAKTTIEFLVDIPSVLSKYIFFCITAEAYDMATFFPMVEIKDQFITAVLENCYQRKTAYIKEVWMNLTTSSLLKEKINNCNFYLELIKNEAWWELPSLQSLNGCFEYFDVSDRNVVKWDLKCFPLGQRLISTLRRDGVNIYLSGDVFLETDNCFQKLGYKTQYINIYNNDSDKYDKLFFRWYCMGEVLDIVLETIFSNRNIQLSKSLYCHLMEACKDNNMLAKLVQARYDQIVSYHPGLKNITFYDGQSKPVVVDNEIVEEIEMESLPYGVGKIKGYSDDDYVRLFKSLIKLGPLRHVDYVEKYGNSLDDFLSVFSDGKIKNRLYWYGTAEDLAAFCQKLEQFKSDRFRTPRAFYNKIGECFIRLDKDNKRVKVDKKNLAKPKNDFMIYIKINMDNKTLCDEMECNNVKNEQIDVYDLNYKALVYNNTQLRTLTPYLVEFKNTHNMPLERDRLKELYNQYRAK